MESRKKLTQERLKELLDYDDKTGTFIWKVSKGSVKAGQPSGCSTHTGYYKIRIDGVAYLTHWLCFLWINGSFPKYEIDHIDRNGKNNNILNLRDIPHACNMKNQKVNIRSKTGVSGVSWHKATKRWRAYIKIMGEHIDIGVFKNMLDAVKARWDAEVRYNFPNCCTTSSAYLYIKNNTDAATDSGHISTTFVPEVLPILQYSVPRLP